MDGPGGGMLLMVLMVLTPASSDSTSDCGNFERTRNWREARIVKRRRSLLRRGRTEDGRDLVEEGEDEEEEEWGGGGGGRGGGGGCWLKEG